MASGNTMHAVTRSSMYVVIRSDADMYVNVESTLIGLFPTMEGARQAMVDNYRHYLERNKINPDDLDGYVELALWDEGASIKWLNDYDECDEATAWNIVEGMTEG